MKVREEREPPKKKSIAFRASRSIPEDEDFIDENKEEDFICSLGRWTRHSIIREEREISKGQGNKENLKEKGRK